MRIGSGVGAAVLLGLMIPAHGVAQDTATEAGRWDLEPTREDFERLGPPAAVRDGMSGRATLTCELTAAGRPRDCKVKSETPTGAGFGAAALKLGPLYKVKETREVELEGSELTFVVRFSYAPKQQIAAAPPPPAPVASAPPPPLTSNVAKPAAQPVAAASPPPPVRVPAANPQGLVAPTGRLFQAAVVPGWQADFVDLDRLSVNGQTVEYYRLTVAAPSRGSGGAYELSQLSVDCGTGSQSMIANEVYSGSGGILGRGGPRPALVPAAGTPESAIIAVVCDPVRPTRVDAVGLGQALAMARKDLG